MGSRAALEGISALELTGARQEQLVGVALDPETPPVFAVEFTEQRDVRAGRALREMKGLLPMRPDPIAFTQYLDDDLTPGEALEEVRLSPERLLLEAAGASDAWLAPDTVLGGRRLHVVAWGEPELRLLIDAETSLPAGWTGVRSYCRRPELGGLGGREDARGLVQLVRGLHWAPLSVHDQRLA